VHREKVTFKSAGCSLVGIKDIPDKVPAPGVILFHGLSNAKEDCPLINETAEMLTKEGVITFRFDFYGSGESPGLMRDKTLPILLQNARDAIDFLLSDSRVTAVGLWGRSLGGTMVALCGSDPRVKASVILTGGVLLQKGLTEERMASLREKEEIAEREGKKLAGTGEYKGPYELGDEWYKSIQGIDKRIEESLKKMSHVLVFATTPDIKVPLQNSIKIINTVKEPKEIYIFEGVEHDYKGVEKDVLEIERRWFNTYLMESEK
jgi:dienelactone hydrolase